MVMLCQIEPLLSGLPGLLALRTFVVDGCSKASHYAQFISSPTDQHSQSYDFRYAKDIKNKINAAYRT